MKILDEQQQLLLDNKMLKEQVSALTLAETCHRNTINELATKVNELASALYSLKDLNLNQTYAFSVPPLHIPHKIEDFT